MNIDNNVQKSTFLRAFFHLKNLKMQFFSSILAFFANIGLKYLILGPISPKY